MNKLQVELFTIRDTANIDEDAVYQITLKHMKGVLLFANNLGYTMVDKYIWKSFNDEAGKTTEQLIQEYIKTL